MFFPKRNAIIIPAENLQEKLRWPGGRKSEKGEARCGLPGHDTGEPGLY